MTPRVERRTNTPTCHSEYLNSVRNVSFHLSYATRRPIIYSRYKLLTFNWLYRFRYAGVSSRLPFTKITLQMTTLNSILLSHIWLLTSLHILKVAQFHMISIHTAIYHPIPHIILNSSFFFQIYFILSIKFLVQGNLRVLQRISLHCYSRLVSKFSWIQI